MTRFHYKNFARTWVLFFICFRVMALFADTSQETKIAQLERAIFNFQEIEPGIYRSGRLPRETYPYLKKAGITTIINFIDKKKEAEKEKSELAHLGIKTVSIPWNGFDYPKDQDVDTFLNVMKDPANRPVLVHCKRGAERTGLMIACWRIAEQGWKVEDAYQEMVRNRFRWFWYGHLKKYLYEFAKRHGQKPAKSTNIWGRLKTNVLYGIYRFRKLASFSS